MQKLRKLQFINGQFMLNMPRPIIETLMWEMGDYCMVTKKNKNTLEIHKTADRRATIDQALMPSTQEEAKQLFGALYIGGGDMDSATFSMNLSRISRVLARLRKQKLRNRYRNANKALPVPLD